MSQSMSETSSKSTTVRTIQSAVPSIRLRSLRLAVRLAHRLAPRTLEKFAVAQFRTPRHHRRPEREQTWLESATRFEIPNVPPPGADPEAPRHFAAWSWGEGPTILLVHGWEGRGGQMGAFAEPLVASGYRVVAFDAPAHGETGGKQSSLPELAHSILAAAEACGPLHGLVAHSFGCAGSALAIRWGLEAERFVFLAAPDDFGGYLLETVRGLGLPEAVYHQAVSFIEDRFDISWEEVRRITIDAANSTPLLAVHDRGDGETSFAGGATVARSWPNGRLLATDGLGHRRILRDPGVIEEVTGFLTEPHTQQANGGQRRVS